ncbi:hypothetical protein BH09SUM1_BH09SUM1_29690 [soil metagenome]
MQRKLSAIFLILAIVGAGVAGWFAIVEWQQVPKIGVPQWAGGLVEEHVPYLYGILGAFILGYLLSFDARRSKRPFELVLPAAFAGGCVAGIVAREAISAYDMTGTIFTENPLQGVLIYTILLFVATGVLAVCLVILFEALNRTIWSTLAVGFDKKEMPNLALSANRVSLLFRPGQEGMLRSVALARFRKGVRGEVVATLQSLYDTGERDADLLEALTKAAYESNDRPRYLIHLRELHEKHPDESEISAALLEELIDQQKHSEALALMEKAGVPQTEEALDRHASLLLAEGQVERAVAVAKELGEVEGIPFRRSQKILRDILSRISEFVPALNILATHAERMGLREPRMRWLEKSLQANPRQPEIRAQLMAIFRDAGQTTKLEPLFEAAVYENPRDRDLLFEFINVLHQNEKSADALERLQAFNQRSDATAASFTLEAQIRFDKQQYDEAKEIAQNALKKHPTEDQQKRLNTILHKIEQAVLTVEVSAALDEARANLDDLPIQLNAIQRLIDGGHAEKVVRMTDDTLTRHPEARESIVERLQAFAQKPDVPFSILNLLADQYSLQNKLDQSLEIVQAMTNRSIDKVSTVRDASQKILRRSPHHLPTLRFMGDTYLAHGRFTDMIHSYSLYLAHGGDETDQIDRALAKAYMALGDFHRARPFVNQLLETTPGDITLLKQVVPLAITAHEPEDAANFLKKLEIADPRDADLKKLKEAVEMSMGERRFAFLKRELEAGKGNTETLEQLGDIASKMGNFHDAITYYQRASRDPEDAYRGRRCTAKLAFCYLKKRLDDLASETLREITISLDDDPTELQVVMDILYDIGQLFLEAKHYAKAANVFKQLCKIDAGYRDVLNKVENLRA